MSAGIRKHVHKSFTYYSDHTLHRLLLSVSVFVHVTMTRSSSGGVAIRYMLPVMVRNLRREKDVSQDESNGGSTLWHRTVYSK